NTLTLYVSLHDALPICITGMLMGPLIGGTIADAVGYAATFKLFPISIFLSAIIVTFGIKEVKLQTSEVAETKSYSSKEVLRHIRSEEHTSELQSRFDLV